MTRGKTILFVESAAPAAASATAPAGATARPPEAGQLYETIGQLREAGYTVIVSPTGEDALAQVRAAANAVDLVLLEIDLPGSMDGIQIAREILEERDLPILFFTSAAASAEALANLEELGAYGCLPKPCASSVLLASLKIALRLHAQKQENAAANAQLHLSIDRLQSMLESAPDTILRIDSQGIIRYVNQVKPGYSREQLIGSSIYAYVLPKSRPALAAALEAAFTSGKQGEYEIRHPGPDGKIHDLKVQLVPIKGDRQTNGALIFCLDISERKRAEAALYESQVRATAMLNAIPDLMFRLSREGIYLDYKAEKKDLVFQGDSIIGQSLHSVTPPEFAEMYLKHIAAALDTGQMQIFEYHLDIPGLGPRDYEARLVASGPDETTSIVRDITERKRAEDELRTSEAHLRMATQVGRIGTYEYNYATNQGNWSAELKEFWGYRPDEEIVLDADKLIPGVHPDDRQRTVEALARSSDPAGDGALDTEFRVIHRDGSLHWLRLRGQAYFTGQGSERRPVKSYGAVIDITARKRVQETLELALQEKGILMRELQHRVKNSLNIAASLLSLEMDNLTDERSLAVLADAQARIRSIAAVYERLNQEGQVDQIELSEYIRSLVSALISSYVPEGRVKLATDLDPMPLDLKRALPLGLILNELITNALKYAFPAGRPGVIRVALHNDETGTILRVEDNGVGMKEDAAGSKDAAGSWDAAASSGRMGLKLVDMLAQQINGSFGYENAGGLSAWVRF